MHDLYDIPRVYIHVSAVFLSEHDATFEQKICLPSLSL